MKSQRKTRSVNNNKNKFTISLHENEGKLQTAFLSIQQTSYNQLYYSFLAGNKKV